MINLSVITPSLPERSQFLKEAVDSVAAQLGQKPLAHIVGIDIARIGPAAMRNKLVRSVDTEWVFFLDDDDLLDNNHFDLIYPYLDSSADVVYSWPRFEGRNDVTFSFGFDPDLLPNGNFIPVTAAVRRSTFVELGGFPENEIYEDWKLWLKIFNSGGKFVTVPRETWTYRWHGGNRSFENDAKSR